MGCLFCNITNCKEFAQGMELPAANPFYCETPEERAEFVEEICYALVARHPEVVKRIMFYIVVALASSFKKWLRSLWPL